MTVLIEWLRLPQTLPATLDPQVRQYFQGLTTGLRYFADQVAQRLNGDPPAPLTAEEIAQLRALLRKQGATP